MFWAKCEDVTSEGYGTESDLELELVERRARFDCKWPELCGQAARALDPNQFGQNPDAKDGLIRTAITHGAVQHGMTHVTSAQHGTA